MTARTEFAYPRPLPTDSQLLHSAWATVNAMYDEIDSLRRWKSEALQVLDQWEQVWIAAGCPGPLGSSKAESVWRLFERRPQPPQEGCSR